MEIQFEMELDTPLGGPAILNTGDNLLNVDCKRDLEKKKKKNGCNPAWEAAEQVYPPTSSPSQRLSTPVSSSHRESPTRTSPSRSPKAYRASLPHTLTLAPEPQIQSQTVTTPSQKQALNDTSSYHHLKMKYMRSLNFTPEELKSLRMRGRDRSQSVTLPLGQSMPIPVSGGTTPNGTDSRLSSSVYEGDDYSSTFVPPHMLVRHDETFSVWHYEQKKIASKDAV